VVLYWLRCPGDLPDRCAVLILCGDTVTALAGIGIDTPRGKWHEAAVQCAAKIAAAVA
jgi:hypothetical protein